MIRLKMRGAAFTFHIFYSFEHFVSDQIGVNSTKKYLQILLFSIFFCDEYNTILLAEKSVEVCVVATINILVEKTSHICTEISTFVQIAGEKDFAFFVLLKASI